MINLQVIIDGLEMVDDMNTVFLDLEAEDTVFLSGFDPDITADTAALIEEHPDRFLRLPSQREIDEYGMMEAWIDSLPEGDRKATLEMAIRGRGAFRRFKDTVARFGMDKRWYEYRDQCYARLARRWCDDNDIEYFQKGVAGPGGLGKLLEDIAEDEGEGEPVNIVKLDRTALAGDGVLTDLLKTILSDGDHIRSVDITLPDDEDEADDARSTIDPDQAVAIYEIYEQLQDIQTRLEDLMGEIDADDVGEVLSGASDGVEDALDSLGEMIEGSLDVNVLVDENTSKEGLVRLAEMMKRMAGEDEPEDK